MSQTKQRINYTRSKSKCPSTVDIIRKEIEVCSSESSHSIGRNPLNKYRKHHKCKHIISVKSMLNQFLISYLTISLAFNPIMQCYASAGSLSSSSAPHSEQSSDHHRSPHKLTSSQHHSAHSHSHHKQRDTINATAHMKAVAAVAASIDNDHKRLAKLQEQFDLHHSGANTSDDYEDDYDDEEELSHKNNINPIFYSMQKVSSQNFVNQEFRIKNTTDYNLNDDMSASMDAPGSSNCRACRMREELKQASLLSIKNHILQKLSMYNRTKTVEYPSVPPSIIDEFCKNSDCVGSSCECKSKKSVQKSPFDYQDDEMQGDDPFAGSQQTLGDDMDGGKEVIEDEEDDYYPVPNSIYAFPRVKMRHRKKDVLQFRFDPQENHVVSEAKLNLYVHNERWLKRNEPNVFKQLNGIRNIDISVYRVIRRNSQNKNMDGQLLLQLENKLENVTLQSEHNIDGRYVQVDATQLVNEWIQNPQSNHGMHIEVKGSGTNTTFNKIVSLDLNSGEIMPFIEIKLKDLRKRRTKRSISLNCNEHTNETRCCRYPLTVDFEHFGWDWIIAPKRYDANYCAGECKLTFLPKYPHTHVWQLSTAANPCCSPRKMSPIKLLYFDLNFNIVYSTIPNMIVEKCSCS